MYEFNIPFLAGIAYISFAFGVVLGDKDAKWRHVIGVLVIMGGPFILGYLAGIQ